MSPQIEVQNYGHSTRNGGDVRIYSGEAPPHHELRGDAVVIGTLELRPWKTSDVGISNLRFRRDQSGIAALLGSVLVADLAESPTTKQHHERTPSTTDERDDDYVLTRRALLAAATTVAAVGATTRNSRAATPSASDVAEFRIEENPQGVQIGVTDGLEDHLPTDQEYLVSVNGERRGTFKPGEERLTLPPETTGDVEVSSENAAGTFGTIMAQYFSKDDLEFTDIAADGLATSEQYSDRVGERIVLDDHLIADAASDRPGDAVTLTIGGTEVPHANADTADIGYWHVQGGDLMYTIGEAAPDARLFSITIDGDSGFGVF